MVNHLTTNALNSDDQKYISTLLKEVSADLEKMKTKDCSKDNSLHRLPPACFEIIRSLPGNKSCVDCKAKNPDWATVSYGALLCMNCAAKHRSLGVNYSKVRSLTMDHWSTQQILRMLEGGNHQLRMFFERHDLMENNANRYFTKAARFYRRGMDQHVEKLAKQPYEGREASRSGYSCSSNDRQQKQEQSISNLCCT